MTDPRSQRPTVVIYTDGACDPNPGPGGWGAILRSGEHEKELSGGEPETTNNRMELRATAEALRALKRPCRVELHTDSQYLRRGVTEWLPGWQAGGWRTSAKKAVVNRDLWQALVEAMEPHEIEWRWVKGHAGDELNERADALARAAIPRPTLPVDDPEAAHLFTGASSLTPAGPGAWAAVLCLGGEVQEFGGREALATANRLQILAVAEGLRALPAGTRVHVYTPSDYVQQGASTWLSAWQRRGWKTKDGRPVKNKDAWQVLAAAAAPLQMRWHVMKRVVHPPETIRAHELAGELARQS